MLDERGFRRPTYEQLKEEMEAEAKSKFGDDINLKITSPLGIILHLFAWFLAKVWETVEKVYYNRFIGTASGISLDRALPYGMIKRFTEDWAKGEIQITGEPNQTIEAGFQVATISDIFFETIDDCSLNANGIGVVPIQCLEVGSIGNVNAGEITVVVNPNANVMSIVNATATTGGQDYEEDYDLTRRAQESTGVNGDSTTDAIVAAVRNIDTVRSANIKVNNKMIPVDGMPPKSFQVFTLGGNAQEIADTIFSKMAGGIEAYGSADVNVTDISNNVHAIGFTPATVVNVLMDVSIKVDNSFPTNGIELIQTEIIKVIGGTVNGVTYNGLNMGNDVIVFQVQRAVGKVDGVIDATVTLGRDWQSLLNKNLSIESHEVAETSALSISVVIE